MFAKILKGAPPNNTNAAKDHVKAITNEGALKRWGGSMEHTGVPHGTVLSVREGNGFNSTSKNYLAHSDGNWHELGDMSVYKGTQRASIKPDGNKIPDSKMAEIGQTGAAGIVREGGSRNGKLDSMFDLEAMPEGAKLHLRAIRDYQQPTTTIKLPDGTWKPDHTYNLDVDSPEYMKQKPNTEGKSFKAIEIAHWANNPDFPIKVLN